MKGNIKDPREGEEKKKEFLPSYLLLQVKSRQDHGEERCGCLDDGSQGTLDTGKPNDLQQEKKDGIENGERKELQEIFPSDF